MHRQNTQNILKNAKKGPEGLHNMKNERLAAALKYCEVRRAIEEGRELDRRYIYIEEMVHRNGHTGNVHREHTG